MKKFQWGIFKQRIDCVVTHLTTSTTVSDELHILLIDDDPTVNLLNQIVIERSNIGAVISQETHAPDALEMLAAGKLKPTLILLDLNMPAMNGWQFVEEYGKFSDSSSKTKIIILSSSINPSDREKASNISLISDFFSKPLSAEKVKEIKELL